MHAPLPNLPADWRGDVVDPLELEDMPDRASMAVIIVYGDLACNHTASRFYCPGKGALFWDPGGSYGTEGVVSVSRKRDVIIDNIPSLNDYLHWRKYVPSSVTEIFIWDNNEEEICQLYDKIAAASRREKHAEFDSNAAGLFCSAATSSFLRDHAAELVEVEKWGLPHNLSKQFHQGGGASRIYIIDHESALIKRYRPD